MAPQLSCCVVNTFFRCSASRWIWWILVHRRSTHAKAPYAWPPSLGDFCVTTLSKHPQKRITQHLFCVQRNPTFEFGLEVDEKIFSMLNVCIKGVARGALSISRICYDLFQSQLMKTECDCSCRQELIPCCIAAMNVPFDFDRRTVCDDRASSSAVASHAEKALRGHWLVLRRCGLIVAGQQVGSFVFGRRPHPNINCAKNGSMMGCVWQLRQAVI